MVALVEDGRALVSSAARLSPDAIVADISMPGLDGIEASSADPAQRPGCSDRPRDRALRVRPGRRGLAAGALGYVLKDAAGDELVPAVRAALDGERFVSGALAGPGKSRWEVTSCEVPFKSFERDASRVARTHRARRGEAARRAGVDPGVAAAGPDPLAVGSDSDSGAW